MKALSLWQPWASLIAVGAKRFETRGWATAYRGPLVICAAKRPTDIHEWPWQATQRALAGQLTRLGDVTDLPLGAALCLVDLVGCYKADDPHLFDDVLLSPDEKEFGDFSAGRFAWRLQNVRAFTEPIPVKGRQGLFNLSAEEQRRVEQQLGFVGVG